MVTRGWLGGDFSVILSEEEKLGGLDYTVQESIDFAQCISACALTEVNYTGSKYIWWNGRINHACIFERLDRILVNKELFNIFQHVEVQHDIRQGSDYAPLYLIYNSNKKNFPKPFRFLNFQCRHSNFKSIMEQNWKTDYVVTIPGTSFQAGQIEEGTKGIEQKGIWQHLCVDYHT